MAEKHYNAAYLEDTARILNDLKEYSYYPFKRINAGKLIDLGCGPGIDVIKMSQTFDEKVRIIGIDHDSNMLEKAKVSAADISNIDFILSEANIIPFDDDSISGVRAERLIQHLTNPEKTIQEVYRVLKEDYPFVIVETDWAGLSFYNEFFQTGQKISRYLTEKKVNNGYASRKVVSYLQNCNFRDIQLEIFPFVLKSLKEANDYLWIEQVIKEAVIENFISQREAKLFLKSIQEADEHNYFACSMNLVVITSKK